MSETYNEGTMVEVRWSVVETTTYRATLNLRQIIPAEELPNALAALHEGQSLASVVDQYSEMGEHEISRYEDWYDVQDRSIQVVEEMKGA